jgi:hypothetical protein
MFGSLQSRYERLSQGDGSGSEREKRALSVKGVVNVVRNTASRASFWTKALAAGSVFILILFLGAISSSPVFYPSTPSLNSYLR